MTSGFELVCVGRRQTIALGRRLGGVLQAGDFVALSGPLGAGKTCLVKGIAAGLGVPRDEPVVSPTFVLIREYRGRLRLYHVDVYRLRNDADLLALGIEEMMSQPGTVVALEWADRVLGAIPEHACRILLDYAGRKSRRVCLSWPAPDRLAKVRALVGG